MQEQLISYKTGVLAKEKGWDGDFIESHKILTTQSVLQKWLREQIGSINSDIDELKLELKELQYGS